MLAGLIAGAVATLAKTYWEENFPVRDEETDTPPAILAQRVSEKELTDDEEKTAETTIHWTFGTGAGAIYGMLAEESSLVSSGLGLPFGVVFWAMTHGSVVPALDLEPYPTEVEPQRYAVNEFAGHLVYGVTAEVVRRAVRGLM